MKHLRVHEHKHEHDLILSQKEDGDGDGDGDGDEEVQCGGCGEEIRGQIYYLCNLCESHFHHETCAQLSIKHFFHPCPLFLHLSSNFSCNSCSSNWCGYPTYRCERCDFDMCSECVARRGEGEGERILHCCHRHPLQPLHLESESSLSCRICDKPCSLEEGRPTWGCEPCNFHLHESCLLLLPETVQLKSSDTGPTSWVLQKTILSETCSGCNETILSNLAFRDDGIRRRGEYLCISCVLLNRLIHESSSSQVPKVINHFFHPPPDLKLIFSPYSTCNACFLNNHTFSYHCKSCDFFLCLDCAQLPKVISHKNLANQLVQHFCHWHPLKLFTGRNKYTNHICSLCERFCSETFYSCNDQCQFYIHKSCMDSLPQTTDHRLLSQTLVLLPLPSFECTNCNRQRSGLAYYCDARKCKFCIKCVLWPENVLGDDGRFISIHHWHKLSLHETKIEDKRQICFLCKELCIPWTWSYKCSECSLFFHKSCAELPAELEHLIHPQHRLTLTKRSASDSNMTCKLCFKNLSRNFPHFDWVYQCQECNFQLDTQCATFLPSVEYKGHPHLLVVVVNMHGNTNCQVCGKSCKGSCTIHCADQGCDFSLHLQCGPLPLTVKHVCHVHPLRLTEYYVEDNDSDLFACHICEEERDPRLRVYYCSEGCLMISDVICVLYQVLSLLRGEHREVELRTPFPQVASRVINNKLAFAMMKLDSTIQESGDENKMNKYVFSSRKLFFSFKGQVRIASEIYDGAQLEIDVGSYPFSWKALSFFMKLLLVPSINIQTLPLIQQYNGSTTTRDCALPKILTPIYEEFFGAYNVIDRRCNLNLAKKRSMIFITCCFLHEMRMTKLVDVTKDTILVWLGLIRFVQEIGGFNVGFVAENFEHIWQAHYYIQSKKIVDEKTLRLEQELEQVAMYEAELRTKMDELRIKMEEANARHQELEAMDKEHDTYRVVGSRGPMKKVRSNALAIKWRNCYELLVTRSSNAPSM